MKIKSVAANSDGFTLLELIVTIAIVAILTTIALPAFNTSMSRSRVTSNTNLVVGAINYARSEAIDRGAQVIFREVATGWEVVSGGQQLRIIEPPSQSVVITTALADVTFEASGFRTFGDAAGDLLISDPATGVQRRVCVNVSGGTKVTNGSACP